MAMEALCSNEIFNFILYDTTPSFNNYSPTSPNNFLSHHQYLTTQSSPPSSAVPEILPSPQGRKKRRRRTTTKVCKNKEEAESQRMTHIAVERNRRKLMNEHLAVLRSLMPESYVQRGDQASVVGGAISFVKELEHLLQTLQSQQVKRDSSDDTSAGAGGASATFSQFFAFPQNSICSQMPNKYARSKSNYGGVADVEVTVIESHANIRALCQRRLRQLSKLLSGFHSIHLTVLHLNVTTFDPLVLYSISAKVEEGCELKSADEIVAAVHQMLKMIEENVHPSLI